MFVPYLVLKEINNKSFIQDLDIVLILHNVQYAKNVAEIFQLAKAFRITKIYISGDSQKPPFGNDLQKASQRAEFKVKWEKAENIEILFKEVKKKGYKLISLDTTTKSNSIFDYKPDFDKIAIVIGNDSTGLSKELLTQIDHKFFVPNNLESGCFNINLMLSSILTSIFINKSK